MTETAPFRSIVPTAIWSVILHPPGLRPEDLIDAAIAAMRHEYEQLDTERVDAVIAGREVPGSEMNFYCLDLTNTAVVRSYATEDGTYLVFCQADDREYSEVGPVFEAITQSLIAHHAEVPAAL